MSDRIHTDEHSEENRPAEREPVAGSPDRELVARVLKERARKLARPLAEEQLEDTADLVTLEVDGHRFAVESDLVREVFSVRAVTPLPTAPDFVLGITNVRGRIVAVLDLLRILGLGVAGRSGGQVVIVEVGGVDVAFDIGESGVAQVPLSHLRDSSTAAGPYVKAVTPDQLGVLDVERIIAETRQTAASLATGDSA